MRLTPIQALPAGWTATPLKYLATSSGGLTPSKDKPQYWDGDVPWVTPKDMKRPVLADSQDHVSAQALEETGLKLHPPEGVMVVTRGMILAHTFPVARNSAPVTVNQDMKVLRPGPDTDARYLAWLLQGLSSVMLSLTDESAHGTKALRTDQWENLPVPVPRDRGVQERIANFLDEKTARIDALIAEKEVLRERVYEYQDAEVSRLVRTGFSARSAPTGREVLPQAPEGWRVTAFKRAVSGMEQGWSPQCDSRPAEAGEWGVLKVGCVNGLDFDAGENKALPPELEPDLACALRKGDVLMSRANTRELVGMAAMVDADYPNLLLCDKLYRLKLRADWLEPAFAVLLLRCDYVRRQIELGASGASASMQNISQDVVRELTVAIPSLDEQARIVLEARKVRNACSSLVKHVVEHIARLREYRSSLISAAVTGQLDFGDRKTLSEERLAA